MWGAVGCAGRGLDVVGRAAVAAAWLWRVLVDVDEFLELLEHVGYVVHLVDVLEHLVDVLEHLVDQLVVEQLVVDQLVEHVDVAFLVLFLVVVGDLMDHDHPADVVVDVDQRVRHLLDLRHRVVDDDTFQQWRRELVAAPDVVQWRYWGRATAPHRF